MLTQAESQRYDRQVRIWGAEAQVRLQTSKVLLSGLRGLNVEVAKNLGEMPVHGIRVGDVTLRRRNMSLTCIIEAVSID